VIRRSLSVGGVRWLRRAQTLAGIIKAKAGVKREVQDGYILEGRKSNNVRIATVLDPLSLLFFVGPGPFAPTGSFDGGYGSTDTPTTEMARDNLNWYWHVDPLPLADTPCRRLYTVRRASLRARSEADADTSAEYNAFQHGSLEFDTGYRTYGLSTAKTITVGGSQRVVYYRTVANPVFYAFTFSTYYGYPNGSFNAEGGFVTSDPGGGAYGLAMDSDWLENYLGDGSQVVMDWPEGGTNPYTIWTSDSDGSRFQAPWIYGSLVSHGSGQAVWQVCGRVTQAPGGTRDYWGSRKLVALRVVVTDNGADVSPTAVPGAVTYYDPALSSDPARVPDPDDSPDMWRRNSFCAPAIGPHGAMVIGQTVQQDVGSLVSQYSAVLLTTSGAFVELDLTAVDPRRKTWFIGGDEVDGIVYMLNPYLRDGVMAVVDASNGSVIEVAVPTWKAPLATESAGRYSEDHMRNQVTWIGDNLLAFPVADATGLTVALATYDVITGAVVVSAPMFSDTLTNMRGGVSKVGVVQRQITAEDDTVTPAVLLAGYNNGTLASRVATGRSYISYDSGVTWSQISSIYGPSRAIGVVGNGLYYPKPGQMWRPQV